MTSSFVQEDYLNELQLVHMLALQPCSLCCSSLLLPRFLNSLCAVTVVKGICLAKYIEKQDHLVVYSLEVRRKQEALLLALALNLSYKTAMNSQAGCMQRVEERGCSYYTCQFKQRKPHVKFTQEDETYRSFQCHIHFLPNVEEGQMARIFLSIKSLLLFNIFSSKQQQSNLFSHHSC